MNKVLLTGNLCKDIEVRTTTSGMKVISNTIAVRRDRKEADGIYASDFINIVVWDKQADYLETYGHKGDRVELVGRWQARNYTAKDGSKGTAHECVVESMSVFSSKDTATTTEKPAVKQTSKNLDKVDVSDDDLPF